MRKYAIVLLAGSAAFAAPSHQAHLALAQGVVWSSEQPEPVTLDASVAEQTTSVNEKGEALGWQEEQVQIAPDTIDRPLTELERLSLSKSGVGFGFDGYNSKSDNPLEPISVTIRALDKITAQYIDLDIDIGTVKAFGQLDILARTCDKRPPEEVPETTAFLEVFSKQKQVVEDTAKKPVEVDVSAMPEPAPEPAEVTTADLNGASAVEATTGKSDIGKSDEEDVVLPKGDSLFRGWMFASSPALNPLEHPVYDLWVIDCKMVEPEV